MDTEMLDSSSDKIVSRKNFLLAATGAAAYLGSASRAKATDTNYAYLDASTPFTANQSFGSIASGSSSGPVYIESGYPWVDVRGLRLPTDTSDDASISRAFTKAIHSAGTNAQGNFTIYFPPGYYYINNPIQPPNSASNYIMMGAGPWSSVIYWQGTAANQSMLQLVNARGVTIRGLGFVGNATSPVQPPAYGIEINRAAGMNGTANPTDIVVENCYVGSPAMNTMGTAIGYTVASSSLDAPNNSTPTGFSTFRNVTIANVTTAYHFGTANSYGNIILGGSITGGLNVIDEIGVPYSTAFDNTPGPNATYGGSYSLFGTTVIQNELIYNVGQSNGYPLNAFSVRGEANVQLMSTGTTAIGPQTVQLLGGSIEFDDPGSGNTALFQSTGGQFESHGFSLLTAHGARWNFSGSAAVAFYGGCLTTCQWLFNGPLQFHDVVETNIYPVSTFYTNLQWQGLLQEYGHNGYLGGIAPGLNGNAALGITSSCFTTSLNTAIVGSPSSICVEGTSMGGRITLYTGNAAGTGWVAQISFPARYTTPAVLIMPAEGNSAEAITTIYTVPSGTNSFYIYTTAPLAITNGYIWNFIIV